MLQHILGLKKYQVGGKHLVKEQKQYVPFPARRYQRCRKQLPEQIGVVTRYC